MYLRKRDSSYIEKPRTSITVSKTEFARHLKTLRSRKGYCYFDQFGRCYIPAPAVWLELLDVRNDPEVERMSLQVMLVDTQPKSPKPSLLNTTIELPVPNDSLTLRKFDFAHNVSHRRYSSGGDGDQHMRLVNTLDMSVYSVYGRSRSKCFVIYLQRCDSSVEEWGFFERRQSQTEWQCICILLYS